MDIDKTLFIMSFSLFWPHDLGYLETCKLQEKYTLPLW